MTEPIQEILKLTIRAVCKTVEELATRHEAKILFGFALCTDDEVSTLYHVFCTKDWVEQNQVSYATIGYIPVEWKQKVETDEFETISELLWNQAGKKYKSSGQWAIQRDRRFEALTLALKECRENQVFEADVLLCVCSTDPSDHLESLEMKAVDKLNLPLISEKFCQALGYEKYRMK